jgi:hypothetical protein
MFKNKNIISIMCLFTGVVLGCIGAFLHYQNNPVVITKTETKTVEVEKSVFNSNQTGQIYRSKKFGYSVIIPDGWKAEENKNMVGILPVTLANIGEDYPFTVKELAGMMGEGAYGMSIEVATTTSETEKMFTELSTKGVYESWPSKDVPSFHITNKKIKNTTVAGMVGIMYSYKEEGFEGGDGPVPRPIIVWIKKGNMDYKIFAGRAIITASDFHLLLSTFKFEK